MGEVDKSSGGGKFNIATADDALRIYHAAIKQRDVHRKNVDFYPDEWRNVAYWTGIIDVFESMMLTKFEELNEEKNE